MPSPIQRKEGKFEAERIDMFYKLNFSCLKFTEFCTMCRKGLCKKLVKIG